MRKWEHAARGIMLGNLFITATLLSCIFWEDLPSAIRIIPQVPAVVVLGVTTNLAFVFWGSAMREGHARHVALVAYFIPVLTAATMCVFMGIPVTWKLAAASVFVAFGALLCKIAVTARRPVC
jgi:drug/metabolite transporter (DMT)-like permease